jgi:hypothetical protein
MSVSLDPLDVIRGWKKVTSEEEMFFLLLLKRAVMLALTSNIASNILDV